MDGEPVDFGPVADNEQEMASNKGTDRELAK